MEGWIKLHRCLTEKPIWSCTSPEQKVILITLLMMANHKGREWEWKGEKFKCESGQFISSLDSIVKRCGKGISTQNVRTALDKFKKYEFLTNESTKTGRLVTIVNWGLYQGEDEQPNKAINKELTKNQQSTNKELTPNKNDKNDKNGKEDINTIEKPSTEAECIWNLYIKKEGKASALKSIPKLLKTISKEELIRAVERYNNKCIKEKTERKFIKQGSTFFNGGYMDYLDSSFEEVAAAKEIVVKDITQTAPPIKNPIKINLADYM